MSLVPCRLPCCWRSRGPSVWLCSCFSSSVPLWDASNVCPLFPAGFPAAGGLVGRQSGCVHVSPRPSPYGTRVTCVPCSLQVALLLAVLWAVSLVVFMFSEVLGIDAFLPNLVLVGFLFLFLFNPFKIAYYSARIWLLKVLVSGDITFPK